MRTADGEEYQWNKVTSTVYNLIIGKLYVDHGGIMRVRNMTSGLVARMQFKEQKLIANRNPHQARDACTPWLPCHVRQKPVGEVLKNCTTVAFIAAAALGCSIGLLDL
jgi:hypothetical protein